MIRSILQQLSEGYGASVQDDAFLVEYFKKYPKMRKLFGSGLRVNRVITHTRAAEHAQYGAYQGKFAITLSDKFWKMWKSNKLGAFAIFTHELGHATADFIGTSVWVNKAKADFGIDVWDLQPSTMDMPFQVYNWEEAFAETFSVIITKDQRGMSLLKKHWSRWLNMVRYFANKAGVL